ncbi:unnamed protein product [Blepharisma stoltei]|uniref:RING-type domain-containing protein n=1 Tax=Blepharisma stoltei TaxID=1481888 RepID=A0AAU9JK42_9CILI|nr:unnamed protein product [Blepharisma stoltei]
MEAPEIKNKPKISCIICDKELEVDHIGIKCPQNDNICSDCSILYVEGIFGGFQANLPPKCPECKLEIPPLVFERQLSLDFLNQYIAWSNTAKDEELKWCPKCNYFEIWAKSSTADLFYCKMPSCKATICIHCNKSFKLPDYEEFSNREINDYEEEANLEKEYEASLEAFFYHQACVELHPLKKKIDMAIEEGEKRCCPGCGLSGRKDENCTHMTCPVCQTIWCYFCGKKEGDCDKDYPGDDIVGHNYDWNINDLRCPMHFTQIHEIDKRWPDNDEGCLNYFHRLLTLKCLKQAINEIGLDNYYKIADHFSSIKNNGYGIDEILNFEEKSLIDRTNGDI